MGVDDGLLNLPFDLYGRYRLVADVLERLKTGSEPLRILDVGGGDALSGFLPEDRVTVPEPSYDAAGGALPYEEGAFDYAVSVDAYRRVGPEAREEHLSELRRTAGRGVLLTAAFDSAAVRGAERVMGEFRRAAHPPGREPDRPPEMESARRFFEERGDAVSVLPNGYVPHWLAMTCLASRAAEGDGGPDGASGGLDAFYNGFLYGFDNAEPAYRHLLVCLKEPADARLEDLISSDPAPERASRSEALFGALAAVVPLAGEVERANVALARRDGLLARKEAQVEDLSRRLAERLVADEVGRSLLIQDLREKRDALQRDLNQMRRNRDELQRQLAAVANSNAWRVLTVLNRARRRVVGSG